MDTIPTQKKKSAKFEHTSAKSSHDKPTEDFGDNDTFTVDGETFKMAPDLKDLPEFDWDDPENIKMVAEEEAERVAKYGKLTTEQLDKICEIKEALLKKDQALPRKTAFDRAWEIVTGNTLKL